MTDVNNPDGLSDARALIADVFRSWDMKRQADAYEAGSYDETLPVQALAARLSPPASTSTAIAAEVEAETYRMMHDIAVNELGYESILEALEAAPHASLLREDEDVFAALEEHEHDDQRELSLLFNHRPHDGPQFNRGQMREAIYHGRKLGERSAAK